MIERLVPDSQKDTALYLLCKNIIVRLAKEMVSDFSMVRAMSELLTTLGYGTCSSYEECVSQTEDIMGKKMPVGVI